MLLASKIKKELEENNISLKNARPEYVRLLPLDSSNIKLEPYVELREGFYDIQKIGSYTYLGGSGAKFRHIGEIGRYCAIAGNITTGQTEHGVNQLSVHPMFSGDWSAQWPHLNSFYNQNKQTHQNSKKLEIASISHKNKRIEIGSDVWIGYGVFIRRGVKIGDGAVIGANSVIVKDVPPYTIVGGNPAREIRKRFPEEIIKELLDLKWWLYPVEVLNGVDWTNPEVALKNLEKNCNQLRPWIPDMIEITSDGSVLKVAGCDGQTIEKEIKSPGSFVKNILSSMKKP